LQWEEALNSFKAKLDGGSDVFGPLIRRFLLGNKHRVSVVMLPDSSLAAKTEEGERAKLDSIRAQLSEQEVRR
jgi:Zn-dependent M16 (insulinase) family peptidase